MSGAPELPEANLLSYERQEADGDMVWVVRWVGMWVMLAGTETLLGVAAPLMAQWLFGGRLGGSPMRLYAVVPVVGGILAVLVGAGLAARMRIAFYGAMGLTALTLVGPALQQFLIGYSGNWAMMAVTLAPQVVLGAVYLTILLALLQRAEGCRVLLPMRIQTLGTVPMGSDSVFLMQRVGYYWLAFPVLAAIQLALLPLVRWVGTSVAAWSWVSTLYVASYALRGICGLMLVQRYRVTLLVLAALLPAELVVMQTAMRMTYRASTPLASLIGSVVQTLGMMALLVLLYRRSGQARRWS